MDREYDSADRNDHVIARFNMWLRARPRQHHLIQIKTRTNRNAITVKMCVYSFGISLVHGEGIKYNEN